MVKQYTPFKDCSRVLGAEILQLRPPAFSDDPKYNTFSYTYYPGGLEISDISIIQENQKFPKPLPGKSLRSPFPRQIIQRDWKFPIAIFIIQEDRKFPKLLFLILALVSMRSKQS